MNDGMGYRTLINASENGGHWGGGWMLVEIVFFSSFFVSLEKGNIYRFEYIQRGIVLI